MRLPCDLSLKQVESRLYSYRELAVSQHLFSSLSLRPQLTESIESLGYAAMTSIQQQSLPQILEGEDVIAQGHTGSGKTAAFAIGLLNQLELNAFEPQALVLCPTRELCEQVASEIRRLARAIPNVKVLSVYGGVAIKNQIDSLAKGVHIVVGTPGRVEDIMIKKSIELESIRTLVLDEADKMLDMGFKKTLEVIVPMLPSERQTLLFSATFPKEIETLANRVTKNPDFIKVAPSQDTARIDEACYLVDRDGDRLEATKKLLLDQGHHQCVVFCNTRQDAQQVAGGLKSSGFSAAALHGDMDQKDRDQTLIRFSNGSLCVLVATDVASRGLDISNLPLVINHQLPKELEVYTHRIGRTGRAGEKGIALSLYTKGEVFRIDKLSAYLGRKLQQKELPVEQVLSQTPLKARMSTLRIEGGKKQKLRPGDLVGALTKTGELSGQQLGDIKIFSQWAYIAVERELAKIALQTISEGRIKGKKFRAKLV